MAELEHSKMQLLKPHPLKVLVISQSPATASMLRTMLSGFFVSSASSLEEAEILIRDVAYVKPPLDFVILDSQSENRADELSRFMHSLPSDPMKGTQLVHLYTPTTDSITGHTAFRSDTPGVVRMTKPPRRARLLQTLLIVKHPHQNTTITSGTTHSQSDDALGHRTLFGNVLVAEGAGRPSVASIVASNIWHWKITL